MHKRRARLFLTIVVFWPWLFIAVEILIIWWATSRGCTISARGPKTCMFMGRDIGERLYGLWSVGYQIAFSFLWVIPGVLFWGVIELIAAIRERRSE